MFWFFHRGLSPHLQRAHAGRTQDSGGNGGQRLSFAALWTPNLRRATLLTFCEKMNYSETWKVEWEKAVLYVSGMTDLFPNDFSTSHLRRRTVEGNEEVNVACFDLGFARDKEPFCTKDLVGPVHHWDAAIPEGANLIRIYADPDDYIDIQVPPRE